MRAFDAHNQQDAPVAFSCFTSAGTDRVWRSLTDPALTRNYLYGLELQSDWVVGGTLRAWLGDHGLEGRVVCVRTEERLSYLLRSREGDPPTYVTWLLRPGRGGTIVTLQVDETDGAGNRTDTEDVWLPVLAALQDLLIGS